MSSADLYRVEFTYPSGQVAIEWFNSDAKATGWAQGLAHTVWDGWGSYRIMRGKTFIDHQWVGRRMKARIRFGLDQGWNLRPTREIAEQCLVRDGFEQVACGNRTSHWARYEDGKRAELSWDD